MTWILLLFVIICILLWRILSCLLLVLILRRTYFSNWLVNTVCGVVCMSFFFFLEHLFPHITSIGQEARGAGCVTHEAAVRLLPGLQAPLPGSGRKPVSNHAAFSLGCLPSVLMTWKLACSGQVIHEREKLGPSMTLTPMHTPFCPPVSWKCSRCPAPLPGRAWIPGSGVTEGHLGGGLPHIPSAFFARKILRTISAAVLFGEFDTHQSKDSKVDKDTSPFLGPPAVPLALSGGLHHPGTCGALFRQADSSCEMSHLWFDVPSWTQIQPSHFFGSHTDSWLSLPSLGMTAFSWQTCDFATWEDLTRGIVIKLGQNRACYYSPVWGQDLNLEVL